MKRKRRSITTGRDALVLPETYATLPRGIGSKLRKAYSLGTRAAKRVYALEKLIEHMPFETDRGRLRELADGHRGFEELLKGVFFEALKLGLFALLELEKNHRERFFRGIFETGDGRGLQGDRPFTEHQLRRLLENTFCAGVMNQHALTCAFLHFDDTAIRPIMDVHRLLRGKVGEEEWIQRCLGGLGVARVARVMLKQGNHAILPTPSEDVHGKIDLIVPVKGESGTYCFSIKASSQTRGVQVRVLRARPRTWKDDDERRFFEGVELLERGHRGCYIPVHLSISSTEEDELREQALTWLLHVVRDTGDVSPRRQAA